MKHAAARLKGFCRFLAVLLLPAGAIAAPAAQPAAAVESRAPTLYHRAARGGTLGTVGFGSRAAARSYAVMVALPAQRSVLLEVHEFGVDVDVEVAAATVATAYSAGQSGSAAAACCACFAAHGSIRTDHDWRFAPGSMAEWDGAWGYGLTMPRRHRPMHAGRCRGRSSPAIRLLPRRG